jgi:hypothetical protein
MQREEKVSSSWRRLFKGEVWPPLPSMSDRQLANESLTSQGIEILCCDKPEELHRAHSQPRKKLEAAKAAASNELSGRYAAIDSG